MNRDNENVERRKDLWEGEEKGLFKGSTWEEADKRLKSKMFLSLGKQSQRCLYQKYTRW